MGRIFLGILITAFGFALVLKADWIYTQFGRIAVAEKYLGTSGGTRLFYRLLGTFIIFVGFLTITNLYVEFFSWVLSPLIKAGGGTQTP